MHFLQGTERLWQWWCVLWLGGSGWLSVWGCTLSPVKRLSNIPSSISLSAVFGLVYRPRDFASYILGIFICNLLLYLAFYIIMKVKGGSRSCPVPGAPVSKGKG